MLTPETVLQGRYRILRSLWTGRYGYRLANMTSGLQHRCVEGNTLL